MTPSPSAGLTVLLPCPFCGSVPDASNPNTFATINTSKYGAVICCITGPEVRTNYMPLEHWRAKAIDAWNDRAPAAHLAAQGREEWRPIETAPRDGRSLLLCRKSRVFVGAAKTMGGTATYWFDSIGHMREPTHWRPLPEAPIPREGER